MSRLALAVLVSGFFVCVHTSQEAIGPKCGGYTLYKDAGGYLMYHEIPVTFDDAKTRCAVEGGVLASPINHGIEAAMMDILNTSNVKNVFTGFSAKRNNGGIFSSIEGVQLSTIVHTWARGEPNNYRGNENCIALSPYGTMSDVRCDYQYPYMCFLKERRAKNVVCGVNGDFTLDNSTGGCYKLHSNELVFDDAARVCEEEGGHLLIINGEAEAQTAKDLLVNYDIGYAIVGFKFYKNSGKWMTIERETIEDAGFAKWDPRVNFKLAQNSSVGLLMKNGFLAIGISSSTSWPFLCEKDPEIVLCK